LNNNSDPSDVVRQGLSLIHECLKRNLKSANCLIYQAQLGLVSADWAHSHGRDTATTLVSALEAARRAVQLESDDTEAAQELARVYWVKARFRNNQEAVKDIAEGMKQLERALKANPNLAHSHAIRAGLYLLQAQRAPDPQQRQGLMWQAKTGFERAVQLNPLLKRQYGKYIAEVEALAQ